MPAHLTPRRDAWTWPASLGGAALSLLILLLLPPAWLRFMLPDRGLRPPLSRPLEPHLRVVELAPASLPPIITPVPSEQTAAPPAVPVWDDDEWWHRAWHGRLAQDLRPRTLRPDSLPSPILTTLLSAGMDLDLILATPDSVIEARLWRLVQTEQLARNDLDGLFSAIARARAYADLKSREAAMYNEFINETVPITK